VLVAYQALAHQVPQVKAAVGQVLAQQAQIHLPEAVEQERV
jgi:hypothetical protein